MTALSIGYEAEEYTSRAPAALSQIKRKVHGQRDAYMK
jgi:hypothetical protein